MRVKRLIWRTLNTLGYNITKIEKRPQTPHERGLRPLFSLLAQGGFSPRYIVDVGANRGIWTRVAVKHFPEARYVMIEPQEALKQYSSDLLNGNGRVTWITAGMSDANGTLPFYTSRRDDSSSFMEGRRENGTAPVDVPILTLNDIAAKYCGGAPDLVKIDAEGFDLKVLSGASDILGKTDVILIEALVFGTGQENSLAAVLRRMDDSGYRVAEITEVNRSPKYGIAWLCELAFLRNECSWLDWVSSYE